jgi:predicted NBD/HSP70 family sugar kinase
MANALTVERRRRVLMAIWRAGAASQSVLHARTGIRANTVGRDLKTLANAGLLRPKPTRARGRGRPHVHYEIDPERRNVVGLALKRGQVEVGKLNLLGKYVRTPESRSAPTAARMLSPAGRLLGAYVDRNTLAVGVATPGFVDLEARSILVHPGFRTRGPVSLASVFRTAGRRAVVLGNDMHALAARWLLTQETGQDADTLLVHFDDGEMGAALLVDGRPNQGCATGANELGHSRFHIKTDPCFCGHQGCLERICSTGFLRLQRPRSESLDTRAAAYRKGRDRDLNEILKHLSTGLGNAVNFTRVERLVLVSRLLRHAPFLEALLKGVRGQFMAAMAQRIEVEIWDQPVLRLAETAGWLAIAGLLLPGWSPSEGADPLRRIR